MNLINLFNKDVVLNAIAYILEQMGGKNDMHTLFKVLYVADKEHLSKYGRTITGDVYIAMQYGPVPSKTYDIFKAVRGDSYFSPGELAQWFHFVNKWIVECDKKPDMDYLSESDKECLDKALAICKGRDFAAITELSHKAAYYNTPRDGRMDFGDIVREAGDSEDYARYIKYKLELESSYK